ncbi:MAG: cytochrome c biogenesis CcdA family protein [Actinomycetota bacterium]|nr:cytochrome c biogenesis protein CcdA [Acidimicrobiia bacterium]MDQ3293735.1 cytochrome c biogenesis CcdA family protein [Actinomycetota bacterium]
MLEGDFAIAFAQGMVAVANPCGFAMLPAYLSFFVGLEGVDTADTRSSLSRALAVGLSVSAGFAVTFAVAGLIIRHLTDALFDIGPWVTVVIGAGLVVLGLALLNGRELKLALPRLDRGGASGSPLSMALYGVSYAVVSLGCTIPLFLSVVGTTITRTSLLSGVAVFVAYAAGFTVLLTSLTIAVALGRRTFVGSIRRALPWIQRISGALVALAGAYVAWYGYYEARRFGDDDALVEGVTGWSSDVARWISDAGPTTLGLVLALVIAAAAVFVASARSRARAR